MSLIRKSTNASAPLAPRTGIAKDGSGALVHVNRTSWLQAPVMALTGHNEAIHGIKFSPDGRQLASASSDRSVLIWNAHDDCKNTLMLKGYDAAVLDIHWSVDSARLFSASADLTIAVWDVETGSRVKRLKGHHQSIINSCCPSRMINPMLVSGDDDGLILVWDPREKSPILTMQHDWPVTTVAFNATGDMVYTGSIDNSIVAWDLKTREMAYKLSGHADTITGIKLSPDGDALLSTAMDNTVRTWDVKPFCAKSDRQMAVYEGVLHGPDRNLLKPCWSSDGQKIACGSADGTVLIWDAKSGAIQYKLPGHRGTVNEVDWHPSAPVIASCSNDRMIFVGELTAK